MDIGGLTGEREGRRTRLTTPQRRALRSTLEIITLRLNIQGPASRSRLLYPLKSYSLLLKSAYSLDQTRRLRRTASFAALCYSKSRRQGSKPGQQMEVNGIGLVCVSRYEKRRERARTDIGEEKAETSRWGIAP